MRYLTHTKYAEHSLEHTIPENWEVIAPSVVSDGGRKPTQSEQLKHLT